MTMNRTFLQRVLVGAVFATAALAAASAWSAASLQFNRPEDAVKYRQGALFVLGQHFSRIGAMANGRIPFDAKAAQEHAEVIAALSKLPMEGFAAGLDKSSSRAKPEVWSEAARFKEHNDKFVVEASKLVAAARTNSVDALKTAYSATASTCKSCHDAYRSH
jgi:cytochrome c556